MQNFQFEGNLAVGLLTSGASTPNGGWRSELQIYSFQVQNIQMSTIFSSKKKNRRKKKKTGLKVCWRHRLFLKLHDAGFQHTCGLFADSKPDVCYRRWKCRLTWLLYSHACVKHSATFTSSHGISQKAQQKTPRGRLSSAARRIQTRGRKRGAAKHGRGCGSYSRSAVTPAAHAGMLPPQKPRSVNKLTWNTFWMLHAWLYLCVSVRCWLTSLQSCLLYAFTLMDELLKSAL